MRKGFTLIELLVVVVVIVTLMAITFRLGSAGSGQTARARTVNRLQRLENCLSGYYAAYGSYPPVALHGSRDYTYDVNIYGVQLDGSGTGSKTQNSGMKVEDTDECWKKVRAACRSQPVGLAHPFCGGNSKDYVTEISDLLKRKEEEKEQTGGTPNKVFFDGFRALNEESPIRDGRDKIEFTGVQGFRLGLMSYLLPRLLAVSSGAVGGGGNEYKNVYKNQHQWLDNNALPCDLKTGMPYDDWEAVFSDLESKDKRWRIAALPSQAVCARWMPNLEGIVKGGGKYYGVDTRNPDFAAISVDAEEPCIFAYNEGSDQYLLKEETVVDGWNREFYYYSPTPHQTYTLWSSGPNMKTFPPWVELDSLGNDERRVVQGWISDDIMHMQN